MGNRNLDPDHTGAADPSGEGALRGELSADDAAYAKKRNPDGQVRVDGEKDTLYEDGLDVEEDDSPPLGTSSTP